MPGREPGIEQQGELGLLERRAGLVLGDLDPDPVADGIGAVLQGLDPPHVQPHGGVELQRLAARGSLGRAEQDPDLLAQLVDEERGGPGLAQVAGHPAQRLGHQPGLQPDVAVPDLALQLRLGHQGRHRVDDDQVHRTGLRPHVRDAEPLLAGVRLGQQQAGAFRVLFCLDAQRGGPFRVQRVLGVDERDQPAGPLHLSRVHQRDRSLAGRFRSVGLDDPATGQPAAGHLVQGDRAGGNPADRLHLVHAQPHDRGLAVLLADSVQGLGQVVSSHRRCPSAHSRLQPAACGFPRTRSGEPAGPLRRGCS